jgi:hypothetical protein
MKPSDYSLQLVMNNLMVLKQLKKTDNIDEK